MSKPKTAKEQKSLRIYRECDEVWTRAAFIIGKHVIEGGPDEEGVERMLAMIFKMAGLMQEYAMFLHDCDPEKAMEECSRAVNHAAGGAVKRAQIVNEIAILQGKIQRPGKGRDAI